MHGRRRDIVRLWSPRMRGWSHHGAGTARRTMLLPVPDGVRAAGPQQVEFVLEASPGPRPGDVLLFAQQRLRVAPGRASVGRPALGARLRPPGFQVSEACEGASTTSAGRLSMLRFRRCSRVSTATLCQRPPGPPSGCSSTITKLPSPHGRTSMAILAAPNHPLPGRPPDGVAGPTATKLPPATLASVRLGQALSLSLRVPRTGSHPKRPLVTEVAATVMCPARCFAERPVSTRHRTQTQGSPGLTQ